MARIGSRHLRWALPIALAAVVAGGAQVSAWADDRTPTLPAATASDLLVKVQDARVSQLSGTVRWHADLGLPALPQQGGGLNWNSLVAGTQTLRVYLDGPQHQRVDLLGDLTQASVIHDQNTLWTWSSADRAVTKVSLPSVTGMTPSHPDAGPPADITPQDLASRLLAMIGPTTSVTVADSAMVAGRQAYTLRIEPRAATSLVGSVQVYMDARTGLVLRTVVTPRGSTEPALDVGFTAIRFQAPAASTFDFTPPPGATVRQISADTKTDLNWPDAPNARLHGSQWTSVVQLTPPSSTSTSTDGGIVWRAARPVHGTFGSGRLLSTRLLSVLRTDDGTIYAGAITPAALLQVAESAG